MSCSPALLPRTNGYSWFPGVLLFLCALGSVVTALAQPAASPAMSSADRNALRLALVAYEQGKLTEAEPVLLNLTKRYPKSYEPNEALGSLYAELGDAERALPYLQRACSVAPKEALAHANLGAAYLKLNRNREAVDELQSAARVDPRNGATQSNLGQALMLTNQPAKAAKAFLAASEFDPANWDLRYNWALALYDAGDAAQSSIVLAAIPEQAMTDQAESLAGDVDEKLGNFKPAVLHYQAAAKMNPSDANLYTLTLELLRHWNWEETIQVADFGTSRFPASDHFRTAAGIAYYAKGDYAAAVGVFSKLLQRDTENAMTADLLGRSCGALGDGVNAGCAVVGDFAQKHPGNAVMTTYAAIAILHAPQADQNLDKAASLLKEAIAADPKYPEAYLRMGVLEQTRLHWAESTPYLEQCVMLNPTGAEGHYRLSRAYAHLGRSQDAQAQIALHQRYSKQSKDSLDSRMQEVMRFILSPSGT